MPWDFDCTAASIDCDLEVSNEDFNVFLVSNVGILHHIIIYSSRLSRVYGNNLLIPLAHFFGTVLLFRVSMKMNTYEDEHVFILTFG
jgi:hypothetical protein